MGFLDDALPPAPAKFPVESQEGISDLYGDGSESQKEAQEATTCSGDGIAGLADQAQHHLVDGFYA